MPITRINLDTGQTAEEQSSALEDAMVKYAESKDPMDLMAATRIWEQSTRYKSGCGACIEGRKKFLEGMDALVHGDVGAALDKIRVASVAVRMKFDRIKGRLGL
jgi:hypothetical protein